MPENFVVTKARYAGEKDNPHGGVLHRYYCTFKDESGSETEDVYWQRKTTLDLPQQHDFYGHIEVGEYGPRFKTDQNPNGGPPRSGGSSGTKDDYWQKKEQRDIESQARMGRAHAQEMALRTITLRQGDVKDWDDGIIQAALTKWTDWFHADVQRFPDADGGGRPNPSEPSRSGEGHTEGLDTDSRATPQPAATVNAQTGFVSKKQRDYWERLLGQSGWQPGEKATVTRYLEQTDKSVVSAAIDSLKDGSDAEREGLLKEAANWAAKQSDVPWDESQ